MIYLIVGHRGVGKTSWLKKIKKLFDRFPKPTVHTPLFFDLDKEIQKNKPHALSTYFRDQKSQRDFRLLEHKILTTLINKYKFKKKIVFIAIGAGFDWKSSALFLNQPRSACKQKFGLHIIHLIRETDSHGRVFFNRPRLLKNKSPYEEYISLYPQREKTYQQISSESFVLPEQDFTFNETEKLFFAHLLFNNCSLKNTFQNTEKKKCINTPAFLAFEASSADRNTKKKMHSEGFTFTHGPFGAEGGAFITLNKESLPSQMDQWPTFIQKRLAWNFVFFELRDDQLNNKQLKYLLKIIPKHKQLLSFRKVKNNFFKKNIQQDQADDSSQAFKLFEQGEGMGRQYDWPLEKELSSYPLRITDRIAPIPTETSSRLVDKELKPIDILKGHDPRSKPKTCCSVPGTSKYLSPLSSTSGIFKCNRHKKKNFLVLSLHKRKNGESVTKLGQRLIQYEANHFKLALPIKSFSELMEGHLWFLQDPKNRSFLPTSTSLLAKKSGRWRWYRQVFGPYMKMNFIREGPSLISDQPFLYEHLLSLKVHGLYSKNLKQKTHALDLQRRSNKSSLQSIKAEKLCRPLFCAVLGDPVAHSASPGFHRKFFSKQGMLFVKIKMTEKEMTKKNLDILQKMGLRFGAVTSPLKKKAFKVCDIKDSPTRSLKSVNTLIWKKGKWLGSNTDHYGFKMFITNLMQQKKPVLKKIATLETVPSYLEKKPTSLSDLSRAHIAVWGGGGVRAFLQKELNQTGLKKKTDLCFFSSSKKTKTIVPYAQFYSARTGKKLNQTARMASFMPKGHGLFVPCTSKYLSPLSSTSGISKCSRYTIEAKSQATATPPSMTEKQKFKSCVKIQSQFEPPRIFNPDTVIWAVGRSRWSSCCFPPLHWRPKLVVDLNYTLDSPGREYALLCGAKKYISGKIIFKNQAIKQQNLFLRHK